MYYRSFFSLLFCILIIQNGFAQRNQKTVFTFSENDQGVQLLENGKPVFFYQEKNKMLAGRYKVSNYLHPLYNLAGDTLTEECPPTDHPYHRGIFWAWHQHYIENKSIGEGWTMNGITYDVVDVRKKIAKGNARLDLTVLWRSSLYQDGKPYMEEKTRITVYPSEPDVRKIDFEISLRGLVPGVQIGGANDEKGYGGFCPRVKLPDGLIFTSDNGAVKPQNTQIKAGPWMDLSGAYGRKGEISGMTIMCHPSTPNYPAPWILRQKLSMQNIVFPGRELTLIPEKKPVVLRYRLVIHNGNAATVDIPGLHSDYEKMKMRK
jgi:hypothetical protein